MRSGELESLKVAASLVFAIEELTSKSGEFKVGIYAIRTKAEPASPA